MLIVQETKYYRNANDFTSCIKTVCKTKYSKKGKPIFKKKKIYRIIDRFKPFDILYEGKLRGKN